MRLIVAISYISFAFYLSSSIKIDNSIKRWLPEDSENLISYKNFLNDFSSDAFLILTFEGIDSIFYNESIQYRIKDLKNIDHVIDISSWPIKGIRHKKKNNDKLKSFVIRFNPESHLNPNRPKLIDEINSRFADLDNNFHLAGTGVIHHAINEQTEEAMSIYLLAGIILLIVVLIVIVRSPLAVILTILVSLGGVSSIIYISIISDIPLSLAHTIIPIIILFYGTSISVHILYHSGRFDKIIIPTLLVFLTTSVGFSVFLFDKTPLLRDFAILGISGLSGTFITSLIIFYPGKYRYTVPHRLKYKFRQIPIINRKWSILILIVTILILIPGIFKLNPEIYSLSVLSNKNKAYTDHTFIESNVGYYFPIEYIINEDKIDRINVSKWVNEVYNINEISGVITYYQIPNYLNKISIGYQSKNNDNAFRITFMAPLLSTSMGIQLADQINSISNQYFRNWLPKLTGFITLYAFVSDGLVKSFQQSLFIAFLVIILVIIMYLKNIKLIFLALTANFFPVISMLGLMGWMDIKLDMVTIPIGCLLISIVVDDTIHLMHWYKKSGNIKDAISMAGPGIFITTIILGLGFSVLLLAEAPPVKYFALLSLFALITALLGDLFLMPSLIKNVRQ